MLLSEMGRGTRRQDGQPRGFIQPEKGHADETEGTAGWGRGKDNPRRRATKGGLRTTRQEAVLSDGPPDLLYTSWDADVG